MAASSSSSFRNYPLDNSGTIDYPQYNNSNHRNVHRSSASVNRVKDVKDSGNHNRSVKKRLEKYSKLLEEQLQKLQQVFAASSMKLILDDETLHEIRAHHLAQLREKLKLSLVSHKRGVMVSANTVTAKTGDEIYDGGDDCDGQFESIIEQISQLNLLTQTQTGHGLNKAEKEEKTEMMIETKLDNEDQPSTVDETELEDEIDEQDDQQQDGSVKIDKTTEIGGCGDENLVRCYSVEGSTEEVSNDDLGAGNSLPIAVSLETLLQPEVIAPLKPVTCSCNYNWQFWFWKSDQRFPKWDYGLQKLSKPFNSLERLQLIFDQLIDIHEIVIPSDYSLFRESIKPKWEDSANKDGGSWTIEFERNSTDVAVIQKIWIGLLKFVISNRHWDSEICGHISGLKISMRFKSYQISLWTLNFVDLHNILKIGISIHRLIDSIISQSNSTPSIQDSSSSSSPVSTASSSVISWPKDQQPQFPHHLNWDLYYRAHKVAQQNALIKEQTKFGYGQFYGQWL